MKGAPERYAERIRMLPGPCRAAARAVLKSLETEKEERVLLCAMESICSPEQNRTVALRDFLRGIKPR